MASKERDRPRALALAGVVLKKLAIDPLIYEVQPVGEDWVVSVQFLGRKSWQSKLLTISRATLFGMETDPSLAGAVLGRWNQILADARRAPHKTARPSSTSLVAHRS